MLRSVRGHSIWPAPLGKTSIVVDAGACHGEFSAAVVQQFGARCFLIEANPVNAAELHVPGVAEIIPAALASSDGPVMFQPRENREAGCIVSDASALDESGAGTAIAVNAVSLATLMRDRGLDRIDLLKLDIEGAEFDLIDATPDDVLRRIGQMSVEFHDFLPRFSGRNLFEKARARLTGLGFLCCVMSFHTHGDVLFLNRSLPQLTPLRAFYAQHLDRYVQGIRRRLLTRP